jgi:membrane peptidoglycan carboxypeptidase
MGKPLRTDLSKAPKPVPDKAGKKPRKLWLRIFLWSTITLVSLALIGTGAVAYAYNTLKIPDPNSDFQTNTTFVYYADGKQSIGSFQVQNRVTISYDTMPQTVKDAIVAAENRSFWTDPGISIPGLMRAAAGLVGISAADQTASGGGSTITQQYIKIMYLNQERTFSRKATEILLAAKMGSQLTKEQILEGYLNTVYFGRGAYGIEAAAQTYFKVAAAKLTLAQSVALADIVNSPGNLDPASGTQQAADLLQRYQYTLNGMVEMGTITDAQRAAIYGALPATQPVNDTARLGGQTGFLLKLVEKELLAKGFTEEQIAGGGLKVTTTFDATAQQNAVDVATKMTKVAANGSKKAAKKLHPAIASIDNSTGGVIAMYGGADYVASSMNWATTPRAVGSTFKPYVLAAALRNGMKLTDTVSDVTGTQGKNGKAARTDGKKVSLLYATAWSRDSAYFNLVNYMNPSGVDAGAQDSIQAANDAGAPSGASWDADAYLPLGAPEISPINQASAYSTFANYGLHRDWHVISQVTDSTGKVLYAPDTTGTQTIEHEVAQDVTYALTKVVTNGTGQSAQFGYPAAGKTGTRGDNHAVVSAWFVGYTSQITTAVMYVAGDGNANLEKVTGRTWYGSIYPAETWAKYMKLAMAGKDKVSFEKATTTSSSASASTSTKSASASSSATKTKTATTSATPSKSSTATAEQSSSATP